MNTTLCSPLLEDSHLCFTTQTLPIYYSTRPSLIEGISDCVLTSISPVIAYWALSLFFHFLDTSGWRWLEKYRIHPSEEVKSRNLVTRAEVVWTVILQQVLQTVLSLVALSEDPRHAANHSQELRRVVLMTEQVLSTVSGMPMPPAVLAQLTSFVYWWGIPGFQVFSAMFIIDIWQYFVHRLMHTNKFLYQKFHSWHHRLYVPYAFGAFYGNPIEGVLLDLGGAVIAEWATGMTLRQTMLLFVVTTLKVVDDHCGYNFPWDPLQLMSGNNACYHDIHHQAVGMKFNFSQPFFFHWDALLGTRMTRQDITRRRLKGAKTQ